MKTNDIREIIRELKTELQQAKREAKGLRPSDSANLYYNGVIVGLQRSIGAYEKWLYSIEPRGKKRR